MIMPSPNTIARRATEPCRRSSYLGPYNYNHDKDAGCMQLVRDGWAPGKLVTSRDGSTTYTIARGGNLVRVK